jgi:glycosyltransferase involved in cell wall biosynthesis
VISVNGRFLTRPKSGVDRFASELLRSWLPISTSHVSVRTVVPSGAEPKTDSLERIDIEAIGRLSGHAWEQLELPWHCRRDMLLSLCNTGPILHRAQLVVLHDAAVVRYPSTYSPMFRAWYPYLFQNLMRRAQTVATVSNFSASELIQCFGRPRGGIEVIYESGEHILRYPANKEVLTRFGLTESSYVLAVGSQTPNKNFEAILEATQRLADLKVKLVVAGGSDSAVYAGTEIDRGNVTMTGHVTDSELRALYENAQCFVFPSLYEGFGLPPLEAMHCGCPVIVANRAALPEICGDAVVYCDPQDTDDIARQLRRVLTSASLRAELAEAGHLRARTFSWRSAAEQLNAMVMRMQASG